MKRRWIKRKRQRYVKMLRQQWVHKRGCTHWDCISKLVEGYKHPTLADAEREYGPWK